MGLQPGQSDCGLCIRRLRDEGGNGSCPYPWNGAVREILRERKDCVKFREGNYFPKKLLPQSEGLF
jgi:hypothetical protein